MDQNWRVEVSIREELGNMTQVLADLCTAQFVLRIVRFDLDSTAVRHQAEVMGRRCMIEAHHLIASPIDICEVRIKGVIG